MQLKNLMGRLLRRRPWVLWSKASENRSVLATDWIERLERCQIPAAAIGPSELRSELAHRWSSGGAVCPPTWAKGCAASWPRPKIPPPMFEHVPELLRRLRLDANLSQQEYAERAGISVSQLSRIENGQQAPQLDTLGRLLDALDLTLADFIRHYQTLERQVDPETAHQAEGRLAAAQVARTLSPLLQTLPVDVAGAQLDFPRHVVYILPKPRP